MPRSDVLDQRTLNRIFLERQLLLKRSTLSVPNAIEHLVGLQAQSPGAPYVGLWTRLQGFRPEQLSRLIETRKAVRIALMRSTIHLVTARDCVALRPVMRVAVERSLGNYRKQLAGVDRDSLLETARTLFASRSLTHAELGDELAKRWRQRDAHALAMAVRCWLPLVQVPPRGVWRASGRAAHTTAERWLGSDIAGDAPPDDVILRYLRAFGPASVRDMQS
ncbi:MAG: winged helix DNA-binding domain-containing protein, partial [Actinomycetota bacterium]|nr:winged helix DNA-binding domain-containing protein [Actinomycetota bacterium]